jgi:ABC-type Fe3+-hydroxamate transport system substrate-binding protein
MSKRSSEVLPGNKPATRGAGAALMGSLLVHGLLALGGGAFIVAKYIQPPAPKFVAPPAPKIKIPPQTRQHRMNLAAHAGLASKPVFKQRLVSLRPTAFALPEAPRINLDANLVPDPSSLVSSMVSGLTGSGGTGSGGGFGLGGAGGLGQGLSSFTFMGLKAQGQKIVLCFDVSGSVVNKADASGVPLAKIKEETIKLIAGLPSGAEFGIIQFVRNYKPFKPGLTQMTPANRDLATQWIEEKWSESGQMPKGGEGVISPPVNGLPRVLEAAFAMKPDVIFVISDGQFEQTTPEEPNRRIPTEEIDDKVKELQKSGPKIAIHFLGFQMRQEDKDGWESITRRTGGRLREIR